jgi:hypothetical protein
MDRNTTVFTAGNGGGEYAAVVTAIVGSDF